MGQELVIVPAGLYTDPSPHGAAPPGALRTATNVVIRRAGAVEPRPGFIQGAPDNRVMVSRVWGILGYPGLDAVVYVGDSFSGDGTWIKSGGIYNAVQDDASQPLVWLRAHIQAAASRKNLYLSTRDAVRKITSGSDTTASKAGAPPCLLFVSGPGVSPGTAVPAGKAVSYRAVLLRKDSNGLIVRSAPSNRVIFQNISGATINPSIMFTLSSQVPTAGAVQVHGRGRDRDPV